MVNGLIFKKDKVISMMKRFRILFFIFFVLSGVLLTNAQTFTKSPYLANPGVIIPLQSGGKVIWKQILVLLMVILKLLVNLFIGKLIGFKKSGYLYEANINKLKTGKTYFYQVRSENISSDINTFKAGVKSNQAF